MTVSPGAIVICRQTGDTPWVVKAQADDGRWRLVQRDARGRLTGRLAGAGDVVEVEPAPEFEPGLSILVGGELHTVLRDVGPALELRTPERRYHTRGRDDLYVPGGNVVTIAKSDLVLEERNREP